MVARPAAVPPGHPCGPSLPQPAAPVQPGVCSGCVYFFPLEEVSSIAHLAGWPRQTFESLKNNGLFCCLANPFLDASFWLRDMYAHQAISAGIYNHLLSTSERGSGSVACCGVLPPSIICMSRARRLTETKDWFRLRPWRGQSQRQGGSK